MHNLNYGKFIRSTSAEQGYIWTIYDNGATWISVKAKNTNDREKEELAIIFGKKDILKGPTNIIRTCKSSG